MKYENNKLLNKLKNYKGDIDGCLSPYPQDKSLEEVIYRHQKTLFINIVEIINPPLTKKTVNEILRYIQSIDLTEQIVRLKYKNYDRTWVLGLQITNITNTDSN